jgi:hypothetical protein
MLHVLVSCVGNFVNCFPNGRHVLSSSTSLVIAMKLALKELAHAAFWKPKATDTHSEYVILTAFPLQQWLHERVSVLRCRYIVFLVSIAFL